MDPLAAEAAMDPLASNVACLDYSAGYGGSLVAYRFDEGLNQRLASYND